MKKILILCVLVLLGAVCALGFSKNTVSVTDYAMNTVITVTASSRGTKKSIEQKIDKAMAEIHRIDRLMSVSNPKSDVYRINTAPKGSYTSVSEEVYSLIEMCISVSEASEGAFDITVNPLSELWDFTADTPTVPDDKEITKLLPMVDYRNISLKNSSVALTKEGMSITLGAVAKGYGADRAALILKNQGITDAVIDMGGNIYALGKKRIGIQTPFEERGKYFDVCIAEDSSVVTSGAYERYFESEGKIYHHILDPKTGYPSQSDLKSVTVTGKNSALADALSTAIFVAGKDKAERLISQFPEFEAKLLSDEGEIIDTKNT